MGASDLHDFANRVSAEMAYIVGLTATDGCLASGRRAINLKSADRQLVETYLTHQGWRHRLPGPVLRHAAIRMVQSIGLTPRKSLTLGAIHIPDAFLAPLVRGLLDGDGNISNAWWRADTSRRSDYYYEWLRTRFASATPAHLEWLKDRLRKRLNLRGWIWRDVTRGNGMGWLTYGKHDSISCCAGFTRIRLRRASSESALHGTAT